MEYENYSLLQLIALFKHTNTYLGCMLKKKHIIDYINRYNIYLETAKEDNEVPSMVRDVILAIEIFVPVVANEICSTAGCVAANDKFEVPSVIGSGVVKYHFVLA